MSVDIGLVSERYIFCESLEESLEFYLSLGYEITSSTPKAVTISRNPQDTLFLHTNIEIPPMLNIYWTSTFDDVEKRFKAAETKFERRDNEEKGFRRIEMWTPEGTAIWINEMREAEKRRVNGLSLLAIPVNDYMRDEDFYREVLSYNFKFREGERASMGYVGKQAVYLYQSEEELPLERPPQTTPLFQVGSVLKVAQLYEMYCQGNEAIEPEVREDGSSYLSIFDLSGNRLDFIGSE
jgi:catechol 2,3-dioxygenase-like lactoylglutathione lyase family enzyme